MVRQVPLDLLEPLDLMGMQVYQVRLDNLELQDRQDRKGQKETWDLRGFQALKVVLDLLGNLDQLAHREIKVHLVIQELQAQLDLQVHLVQLVLLVTKDHQDHKEAQVNQACKDQWDHRVKQEIEDHLDHLVSQVVLEIRDSLDFKAVQVLWETKVFQVRLDLPVLKDHLAHWDLQDH